MNTSFKNIARDTHMPTSPALAPASAPAPGDTGLVRFMASILRAQDIETTWALTRDYLFELGFGDVLYGYSPTFFDGNIGSRDEVLLLSTLDRAVIDALIDNGHYRESITFNWALRNIGVASWAMTAEEGGMPPDFNATSKTQEFFQREGFTAGCTIGFPSVRTRGKAVMALYGPRGSTQDEIDALLARLGDSLLVATSMAHMRLSEMPYIKARNGLTQRQREVLEWVAEGKTAADIAAILGISPVTVDKHLRLARETLDVDTTAHAVIKASVLNQIFVFSPPLR